VHKPLDIMIATPMYGGMAVEPYIRSMLGLTALLVQNRISFGFATTVNESLIPRGRDTLVDEFLQTDCTHLFFIDGDTGFNPSDVLKLCLYDKDVAAAMCPVKAYNFDQGTNKVFTNGDDLQASLLTYVTVPEFEHNQETDQVYPIVRDGLMKARRAVGGFLCIKREVIIKMIEHYSDLKYYPKVGAKQIAGLFQQYIDKDGILLSENFAFSDRWIKMGGEIWVDPEIPLSHFGSHLFPGRPMLKEVLS